MSNARESVFACPHCESSFTVTSPARNALVEHGCAVCGSTVPPGAFE